MTQRHSTETLADLLAPYVGQVEEDLRNWLLEPGVPPEAGEAMRYCVHGGGKRLRPALVLMACEAAGGDPSAEAPRCSAVAVELVHTYSLVHDDLPAMDDDELRRGRATAHVRFGEAMAILAGDALLTRAFGVLAEMNTAEGATLAAELARGAGPAGMIAGQVADMGLCKVPDGAEGPTFIHMHKTAALIRASVRMGAICAGADGRTLDALTRYGEQLGLAFQLTDDLLDVIGTVEQTGKSTGKDAAGGKRTHVGELGLEQSRLRCRKLTGQALEALSPLGDRAASLAHLAEMLAERTH
ncbi:MAG: polyprenyl synthetase family protein [Phycisphaerae bacterium]